MNQPSIESLYRNTYRKLLRVARRFYLLQATRDFLRLSLRAGLLFLFYVLLELLFELPVTIRMSFWVLLGVLFLYGAVKHLLPALRGAFKPARHDIYALSRTIGKQNPDVDDTLINFLNIYHEEGIVSHRALKELSLKQLYRRFRDSNFLEIISWDILRSPSFRLLILAGTFLILLVIFPASVSQAMLKVLYPHAAFRNPLPVTLFNESGDLTVLKNESVVLQGRYEGVTPSRVWLVLKPTPGDDRDTTGVKRLDVPLTPTKTFRYEISHVKQGFTYWFEASLNVRSFRSRHALSDTGRVIVQERPFVRDLQLKLTYPSYTRLPVTLAPPNNGEVTAIKGTRVDIEVETNKSISRALLLFQDSSRVLLTVTGNHARGTFRVERDGQYQVLIWDKDSIPNYQPIKYAVFALNDEFPFVEIARPGEDTDLGDDLKVPMLINMRDDFGFSGLFLKGLHIHAGGAGDTTDFSIQLPIHPIDPNRAISDFVLDVTPFYMVPDDYIEYYAEVKDNDRVSGPKSAKSRVFVLRLPSLMEVLEKSNEQLSENVEDMEDLSKDTEELKKKLEEINRELKREKELSWEHKQDIQEQLNKQKETLKKTEEIRQEVEEMVNELNNQDLLSPETLEKYFELQKMLQDMATPELKEAMQKLQEALEQTDMEKIRQAMEQFQLTMEEFEQRIERTYELFKRIRMEQKMDELVKMAEKLAEQQKQVNDRLNKENLDRKEQEQLARQEKQLEENTDLFEKSLEDLQKEMEETLGDAPKELEQSKEFMENQQLSEQMQAMMQQLQQAQLEQAQQSGQKLEQQLEMLQSMMQQAQQSMTQMQKQELMMEMQKVQQDMLRASFQQEQLSKQSQKMDMASNRLKDVARQQSRLRENATNIIKNLIEISKKTFFISPQMNQIMSSLMENMENALSDLENRNPRAAGQSQKKAMANLNQAIMSMQNSMNQMAQASSASGLEEFMQQLQQMAGQQGQLNQQTLGLFQQQSQGKMQPTPDMLARLAAQQEMIRRSLEQLTQQQGRRGDVLGRLGELGEEMQKVIDDLQKQRVDRRVIERQQRILSRMLDAQKSIREKEHSNKRRAEWEKVASTKSPPALRKEIVERENRLRQEMLKALKEGYSTEYKEFIKSYYEVLSGQEKINR